jgi:UDP-glucose 4-epimerase
MRILVTGGSGFLGQAILPLLAQRGEVVALHRPGSRPPDSSGVRWIGQDLADPLSDDLPDRIDAVFHLAQSRRYREFPDGALDVMEINTMATTRLLDYCRRARGDTFVYASSGAVNGAGPKPIEERDPPAPANLYAVSKRAGERVVEQFRSIMRAHSLRYFFIYGPGQQGMMMPGIMQRIVSGQEVQLAGSDGIAINPVYVDDAARATAAALDLADSETINVAGPETVTVRQIADLLGDELGVEPRFANVAEQPDFVASIERMTTLLPGPTTSPGEGLAQMVAAR